MKPRHALVAALFATSWLAACGADDATSELAGRWNGPGNATINLKSDGTAEGNDGCNDMAAAWKPIDDRTGSFMVTESGDMGCPGVIGWDDAASYFISAGKLTFETSDGEDLTYLTREK